MADNLETPSFDFGITESAHMGNIKEAESFLSDTVIKAKNAGELKEIIEDEEGEDEEGEEIPPVKKTPPKKEDSKKKEVPKKSVAELGEDFLETKGEDEEDEEEGEEDEEEETQIAGRKETKKGGEGSNPFEEFSKELYSLNVLSQEEGDPVYAKTGEELLSLLNKEKRKGAVAWIDNFLEQHGEDRRELFEAIFIKGADPKKYLPVYNQAKALEALDLEQEGNQEKVVREFYRRAGIAEDKIATKIQRLKDAADLQSEAEDFHPQLLEQDKQRAKAIADEAEEALNVQKQIDESYTNSIIKLLQEKAKGKDFEGIPITPKLVKEGFDFLQTKKWKTADGQLLTDFDKLILETKKPENVQKRLMIAFLEKINWDFSKIEKKAVSKQSSELFNSLAQKDIKNKTQQKQTAPVTEW